MQVSISSSTALSMIAYLLLGWLIFWMANRTTKTLTGHLAHQPELPNLEQIGNLPRSGFIAVEKGTYDSLKAAGTSFGDTPRRLQQVSTKLAATEKRVEEIAGLVEAISNLVETSQLKSSEELAALEANIQDGLAFLLQQLPVGEGR